MVIKVLITFFVAFAVSRVILRYRDKSFGAFALVFWALIWSIILFFSWIPRSSDTIANILGVGRGVEALLAVAVVGLLYAVFRLYVKLEWVEHEITSLVRSIALKESQGKDK